MKRVRLILTRLLYPPRRVLAAVPPLSFGALALLFLSGSTKGAAAYTVYSMSAYSLTVLTAAMPGLLRRWRVAFQQCAAVQRFRRSRLGGQYLNDLSFRGRVSIYQGMAVDLLYVVFRAAAGIRYASVWFLTMAVYYLALGGLRAYLAVCYRRRSPAAEYRCYRRTAWLLFLLNIPMGGMIALMVRTNSGYSYPGTVIYLSALYTFYAMGLSIVNLVRFRRLGSPILSAAKVLSFIAALMSVLGLQTAMIAQFSAGNDGYRRMMNTITGSCVYGAVIVIAACMLLHSRAIGKESAVEQIRK